MASNKLVTLDQLQFVKTYVDTKDGLAIKSGDYADNTIKLYTSTDKSGDPAVSFSLPEEMFLDQAKTKFVDSFVWSDAEYPSSTDPSLDGKPVLVLAVKGDTSVSYSFASLEKLVDIVTGGTTNSVSVSVSDDNEITADIKVSAETDNVVQIKEDGIYVPETKIEVATDEEVDALFATT